MKFYGEAPVGVDWMDSVAPIRKPTFLSELAATIRVESDIAMQADIVNYFTDHGEPIKDYNPYASGLIPDDMDEFWEEFQRDHNPNQTILTVARVRDLQRNRRIRDEAGLGASVLGYTIGGMGTSTTIPFIMMPAGVLFKAGIALKGAMSIGKTAMQIAGLAVVEEAFAEYIRHDLDPNRTMRETKTGVVMVGLTAGALGGLGAKMTNSSYRKALKDIEDFKEMRVAAIEEGGLQRWIKNEADSVGGQRVVGPDDLPDKVGWVGSKWLGGGMFPGIRLFTSSAKSVRRTADKLINHAWGSRRSSAENNTRRTEMVARSRTLILGNDGFKKAIAGGYEGKIGKFWEDIGEALISKDVHRNDFVAEVAANLRKEVIEPIKARFQELGDLPEELETRFAESYFPRVYREEVFRDSIEYTGRLKRLLLEKDPKLSDAEALEIADDYMDKMKSWDVSKLPQGVGSTGRLKARGIDLLDTDLQKIGFLEKNALVVLNKYINSVVPEMEIKVAFGGIERAQKLKDLEKQFVERTAEIKKEFEARLKDPKAVRELSREEIEMDFDDYMYFAEEEFLSEQDAIKKIYKGRMEDARVEYDRIRNEVESDFRPIRKKLSDKYKEIHIGRRAERDSQIAKTEKEFKDVEKILRRDFANLKPTTELERVKAQKKLEGRIRSARAARDKQQARIKRKSKADAKEINDVHAKARGELEKRIDDELILHTKAFDDTTNQAGVKQRAEGRKARTDYENKQDKLRHERDRDYKVAQKEKAGSEQALRRQKRSTLKQQKTILKKQKEEEGPGAHLLTKELDEIKEEYKVLIRTAKTQKAVKKLEKRRTEDLVDIQAMRDRLLGIYKRPADDAKHLSNIGKNLRAWAYLAYMGFMTIASVGDMARAIMKHGIGASYRGFRGGFPAFIKGLDAGSKIQRQALNDMGIAVDALLSSRALMMGDISDLTGKGAFATKVFTKLTLMNRWNDAMKHVAGITAQHRFLTQIKNYDSLSVGRKQELKEHGFDADIVDRIRTESGSFTTIKGALMANTDDWMDREIAIHFEKMLLRDVEIAIVTPGVGDSPLLMSRESAKLIFQFKTFFLASHTRAFLPMIRQMSRGDANAFIGFMIQTSLGAFVVEPLRMLLSGKWDEMDEMNWQDWAYAGADRSGTMTLAMELFNLSDKLARGQIGALLGIRNSRYNERGLKPSFGPGIGLGTNFLKMPYDIVKTAFDKDWTERNTSTGRQLIPGQNLFWSRWAFKMAEDAVNDMTDAKE